MKLNWKIVGFSIATVGAISGAIVGSYFLVKKIRSKKKDEITVIPQLEAPKAIEQGAYQPVEHVAGWCTDIFKICKFLYVTKNGFLFRGDPFFAVCSRSEYYKIVVINVTNTPVFRRNILLLLYDKFLLRNIGKT